jgi:hypothetical protein
MITTPTTEYAVHLLQHAANGTKRWRAFIETLPQVTAEAETCEAVLEELGRKLQATLANGESATAPAAADLGDLSPQELAVLEAQVQAQGHKLYGIFADDPGALEVFDEIERLRDEQTIANPAPSSAS